MKRARLALAVVTFLPLFSCKTIPVKPPLVETVAILPFDNETNDLNAADQLQQLVYGALAKSAYRVSDIATTNNHLKEKAGIVDGGQLPVLDPVKIAQDLGVQALVYGYVETFGYLNLGYYMSRKVTLQLKMVDGTTGATLWEKTGTYATRRLAGSDKEAGDQFLKGLGEQASDKLLNMPLAEESRQAVVSALSTLPGFSYAGFLQDSDSTYRKKLKASEEVQKNLFKK